jgi:hypothetical protein
MKQRVAGVLHDSRSNRPGTLIDEYLRDRARRDEPLSLVSREGVVR